MNSIKHPLLESILSHLPLGVASAGLGLRQMDREKDLPILHQWVNQPYAIPFWQMNGPLQQLEEAFTEMQSSYHTLSLAGCLKGELICQLDVYDPFNDPIKNCYYPLKGDMGIHLIVAPGQKPVFDFTAKLLYFLLGSLFRSSGILRVIGEPDEKNEAANRLLHKLSFQFHQRIQLPSKQANFYTISQERFYSLSAAAFAI